MKDTFTLWARPTGGKFPMVHTSVRTDRHEFNCFGDAMRPGDGSQNIVTAIGSDKWAALAYGPDVDKMKVNSGLACGLSLWITGRCQNAANRVLSLTREGTDARGANGNGAVVLVFGKYGFDVQSFIDTVKATGAQLLGNDPGEITQSDIDVAANRLLQGQTPSEELDILHADVQKQFNVSLPAITDDQRVKFCAIYSKFQAEREIAFRATSNPNPQEFERQLVNSLRTPWSTCCDGLVTVLGLDGFRAILGATPEIAKQVFDYY